MYVTRNVSLFSYSSSSLRTWQAAYEQFGKGVDIPGSNSGWSGFDLGANGRSEGEQILPSAARPCFGTGVKTILSRRDYRTEPGVLTPGIRPKMIRPERAADMWYQQFVCLAFYVSHEPILAPLQGGVLFLSTPGVKTQGLVLQSLGTKAHNCPQNRQHQGMK